MKADAELLFKMQSIRYRVPFLGDLLDDTVDLFPPTMRLLYVKVCEEGFCWQLSAKTAALGGKEVPLMRSDKTAGWPLNWHGGTGIEHYWSMAGAKLDSGKVAESLADYSSLSINDILCNVLRLFIDGDSLSLKGF